eukprot:SAG11_NODE_3_length_39220_cov_67.005828_27_plen_187_part_00
MAAWRRSTLGLLIFMLVLSAMLVVELAVVRPSVTALAAMNSRPTQMCKLCTFAVFNTIPLDSKPILAVTAPQGLAAAWWSKSSFVEESDAYVLLAEAQNGQGGTLSTGDDWVDSVLHEGMAQMEAYSCAAYRSCCADEALLAQLNGTCTREHSGASVGAAAASLHDPSAPGFCELLTVSTQSFARI